MLGTIKYSSKVRYGKNKRNIPYYLFYANNNKYIVASKKQTRVDHYALVEIIDQNHKPPKCAILNLLGPINEKEVYTKYVLYQNKLLPRKPIEYKITDKEDRLDLTNETVFSIDPESTTDIDDAFHFKLDYPLELGIHITDLSILDINDFNKLLDYSQTIYTETKVYHLFKNHNAISLNKNDIRNCISLIVTFGDKVTYKFVKTKIQNTYKLSYNEGNKHYLIKKLFIALKRYWGEITNTHQLIEKMMIFYNQKFAEYLQSQNLHFVARSHKGLKEELPLSQQMIKRLCNHKAIYKSSKDEDLIHKGLNLNLYTHASSPMRRVIDYINQMIFTYKTKYDISDICQRINKKDKLIKKSYYMFEKLKLIDVLEEKAFRIFDATVIKFKDHRIKIYINDLNIIDYTQVMEKLSNHIDIIIEEDKMIVTYRNSSIVIKLYETIKVKACITPYESNLGRKVRFFIQQPSLINLIM